MLPQIANSTRLTGVGHFAYIVAGKRSLAATRAGTNCGSCRPEIRLLLRAARQRKAA